MSNQDFELSDSELKALIDFDLISRRNRLLKELKRVEHELGTRIKFSTEYYIHEQQIREAKNYLELLNGKPAVKEAKPDKAQKQQAELLKNLEILKQALASGKVTKEELAAKFAKKG